MRGIIADGERLRRARAGARLTQEELASRAEIDVKTVRNAEQGRRVDVATLVRMALVLNVEVESILRARTEENPREAARRRAVEQWQTGWDARDQEMILAIYSDEIQLHLPGGAEIPFSGTHCGKEAVRRANALAWATAQTVPQTPDDYSLIVQGNVVVLHGLRGLLGPNGETTWLTNVHLFTFDGDFVTDHSVEYDTLRFASVLGLERGTESSQTS